MSLSSTFVLDLWTDKIVAEYTGRQDYAEENYEIARRLALFYNGKINYEAHPYDQLVRLPDGRTIEWGNIKVGDELFAPNGKPVKVIDIPVDGESDIYKVTLADGRNVEASSNHIWSVYTYSKKHSLQEVTTEQMFKAGVTNKFNQKKFFLPDSEAVEYAYRDVPIDPYTLGLLIAEGSFSKFNKNKVNKSEKNTVEFTSEKADLEFYNKVIPYNIRKYGKDNVSYAMRIPHVESILSDLGLLHKVSNNKFIPLLYLLNNYNTRLELLKGLMDGDGCATQGASVFITVSKQLADDVMLLCRSLGIKCMQHKGLDHGYYYDKKSGNKIFCQKVYRVAICSEIPIFKLPRKKQKQHLYQPDAKGSKAKGFLHKSGIVSVEYVGKKKCKCVTVDSPDGLYLIGDYVVTHNCNKKGLFSYMAKTNSTYLLADTLQSLRDQNMIKLKGYGNTAKGVNASAPINEYARELIRRWLVKPVPVIQEVDGEVREVSIPNLYHIQSRALLQELISYNSEGNFDRVSSLGMLMLIREDRNVVNRGAFEEERSAKDPNYLGNDPFFEKNYKRQIIE